MTMKEVMKKADETEAKAIRAVEIWRESPEFDALARDTYVMALEELMKHIRKERLDFNTAFLEESLKEQMKELQRLSESVEVRISPAGEGLENDASILQDLPTS